MSATTRTPSFTLSLRAFLTFPIRLCNPPPAASSVRSCKVTPLIKVSLDDVLNKRHLPPLTLKDFEEWLVFVEGHPHYLYFILWLREYEARYATWLAQYGYCYTPDSTLASPSPAHLNLLPTSPSLALFYTRAKQTFLDPFSHPPSPYALPPAAVSPSSTHSFSASIPHFSPSLEQTRRESLATFSAHPHPHPKELAAVAHYVRTALKESLERFATTACHNVGTRRAWCGIAGGSFLTLIIGVLPTLLAIFYAPSRWWRFIGWIGCWIGGTVILTSLHGICMMIYLFGDLRQLRSFELARPHISQPKAIARARPRLRSLFTRGGSSDSSSFDVTDADHPTPVDDPTPLPKGATTCVPTHTLTRVSQTSTGTPIVHLALTRTALHTISESESKVGDSSPSGTGMMDTQSSMIGSKHKPQSIMIRSGNESTKLILRASDPTIWQAAAHTVKRWVRTTSTLSGLSSGERIRSTETGMTGTRVEMMSVDSSSSRAAAAHTQVVSHAGTFGVRSWIGGMLSRRSHERRLQIEFDDESYAGTPVEDKKMATLMSPEVMEKMSKCECERADNTPVPASIISMPSSEEGEEDPPSTRPASTLTIASSVLEHDTQAPHHFRLTMDMDPTAYAQTHTMTSQGTTMTTSAYTDTRTILSFRSPSTDPDPPPLFHRTAAFITRDYPSDMLDEIPPPRTSHDIVREERAAHRAQPEPLCFDFDQLPLPVPEPASVPAPLPLSLGMSDTLCVDNDTTEVGSQNTAPLRIRPQPLTTTVPTMQQPHLPIPPPPLKPSRSKLWMNSCPRHPAVEAKFASILASQQQPKKGGGHGDELDSPLPSPATSTFTDFSSTTDASGHSRQAAQKHRLFMSGDGGGNGITVPSLLRARGRGRGHSNATSNKGRGKNGTATGAKAKAGDSSWRARFRAVTAVPAFGPLTRVLEPIVARGQWEVVVRSAAYAAVVAWVFVGCLVALPVVNGGAGEGESIM